MATWRIGKNYSRTCPACPRTPSYCLNSLEETTQFAVGETVWAIYETQCVGTTPVSPVNWYKKDITGNWVLYTSWTPPQAYPTAMEVNLTGAVDGCYRVEYSSYATEFTVGTGVCECAIQDYTFLDASGSRPSGKFCSITQSDNFLVEAVVYVGTSNLNKQLQFVSYTILPSGDLWSTRTFVTFTSAGNQTVQIDLKANFGGNISAGVYKLYGLEVYLPSPGGVICSKIDNTYSFGGCTQITVQPLQTFTLNMSVSPSGGGTITTNGQNISTIQVASGSTVIWQATPAIGWQFSHFTLPDGQSTANPVYWLATVSGTTTAVFIRTVTLNMTVSPSNSGTITTNGYNVGSMQVNYNDTVVFQAIPSTGWQFSHFTLPDGQSTANPTYWIATVSGTVTAVFTTTSTAGYICVTPGTQCQYVTSGATYPDLTSCNAVCQVSPPPATGCPGCDLTKNICLDFIGLGCLQKIYVAGAVVAVIALMTLK